MTRNSLNVLPLLCLTTMLFTGVSRAQSEPEAVAEEEDFASQFLGETYAGTLSVDGWTDFGGGLVSPPIYVHHYEHEDGRVLVLTAKETSPASKDAPARFEVTDALLVSKPKRGLTFSVACTKGEDFSLRFMGEARGAEDAEWWTRIGRAWEIELPTGKIATTKSRGVRCTNPSW